MVDFYASEDFITEIILPFILYFAGLHGRLQLRGFLIFHFFGSSEFYE